MTVREKIIEGLLNAAEERLQKLQEIQAPQVMVDGQKNYIEKLGAGELKVGGDTKLLDEEFVSVEARKGNGGKVYYAFNGDINFFPKARYGMFICRDNA